MVIFLLIVGCVLLSGAIVVAPLLLPWPAQLRWLMCARLMGAEALIADGYGGLQMTETQLLAVEPDAAALVVVLADAGGTGRGCTRRLTGPPPGVGRLAALEGWLTTGIPLLLITESDGQMSLHGPRAALTGLRPADADRVAAASS